MTKKNFLDELRQNLKLYNVSDIDEIIAEYEEHFEFKAEEGKSEEEIARRLPPADEIAKDYAESDGQTKRGTAGVKIVGTVFLSLLLFFVFAFIWGSVILLGAFSGASLVTGFCLITTVNIANLIPYLPVLPSLVLGVSFFGLSVITAIGTYYLFLYCKQWCKAYFRWCKNVRSGNAYPSVSMQPRVPKKRAFRLKLIAMIGLAVFVFALAAGYLIMCLYAGNMEPWHTWNWFV